MKASYWISLACMLGVLALGALPSYGCSTSSDMNSGSSGSTGSNSSSGGY